MDDDGPSSSNGVRCWADHVVRQLPGNPGLRYANLAIRRKFLGQVLAKQLEPALALTGTS